MSFTSLTFVKFLDVALAAYWAARRQFIAAGQRVRPVADPLQMLAQVRDKIAAQGIVHLAAMSDVESDGAILGRVKGYDWPVRIDVAVGLRVEMDPRFAGSHYGPAP